jgi:hypothetical protein
MKELSIKKMESLNGGLSCFFAVPYWVLMSSNFVTQIYGDTFVSYCWST